MKNTTKLATLFFIVAAFCFQASAQVTSGKTFGMSTYGAWQSLGISSKEGVRYRATTAGDHPNVFLMYDLLGNTCQALIEFSFLYDAPLNADINQQTIPVNIRVDNDQVYTLRAVYSGVMGDTQGFITLLSTDKYSSLMADMKAGSVMRVKFQYANGQPITTIAFSLLGFTRNISRIQNACLSGLNANKPLVPPTTQPSTPPAPQYLAPNAPTKYL